MRNLLLFLLIMLAGTGAKSQVYIGGTLALNVKSILGNGDSEGSFSFGITPESGYHINERFAAGLTVPIAFGDEYTSVEILPYLRFNFAKVSIVEFFGEFASGWGYASSGGFGMNAFEIYLRPGIKVNLNDKFSLLARNNMLSYMHFDGENYLDIGVNNGFELGCAFKF